MDLNTSLTEAETFLLSKDLIGNFKSDIIRNTRNKYYLKNLSLEKIIQHCKIAVSLFNIRTKAVQGITWIILSISKRLNNKLAMPNRSRVCMDATSLYTNIPHTNSIVACTEVLDFWPWKYPPNECLVKVHTLLIKNNDLTFDWDHYLQVNRTAICTKMVPLYSNIFLGKFKKKNNQKAETNNKKIKWKIKGLHVLFLMIREVLLENIDRVMKNAMMLPTPASLVNISQ